MRKDYNYSSIIDDNINKKEDKLPFWVRKELSTLRRNIKEQKEELENLQKTSDVLKNRRWTSLRGPLESEIVKDTYHLWVIGEDQPYKICSLHKKDILIIGRWDDTE